MRKLLALTVLSTLLTLLMVPLAMAADEENYPTCDGGFLIDEKYEDDTGTLDEEAISKALSSWLINFEQVEAGYIDASRCGSELKADSDGFYNKADCTAAGKVVTEVTEVFAGEVSTDENLVANVYKGLCCLVVEDKTGKCRDARAIYTEDFGTCNSNALQCEKRQWIIGVSGAGIIKVYVKQIYSWGAGIAGFIAVVVIIISGVQIQISGVSGDISQAKQRIMQSIAGLVLIFLSGILLYTINPGFFS